MAKRVKSVADALAPRRLDNRGVPGPSANADALGGLSVAAAARLIGVAPATLRTWDRRYGIGPTEHSPGSHRRYGPDDIARLRQMRQLTHEGVSVATAAALAREASVSGSDRPEQAPPEAEAIDPARSRGLVRAAEALDAAECTRLITEALGQSGVISTWDALLRPALATLGETWERTGQGIEVEHLLSHAAASSFAGYRDSQLGEAALDERAPVMLSCSPEELHTLPLVALSAALAERGVDSTMLGQRMPTSATAEAVRRAGPRSLVLWAQMPVKDSRAVISELPRTRPAYTVFALGPGWGDVPAVVRCPSSLGEAVEAVVADVS